MKIFLPLLLVFLFALPSNAQDNLSLDEKMLTYRYINKIWVFKKELHPSFDMKFKVRMIRDTIPIYDTVEARLKRQPDGMVWDQTSLYNVNQGILLNLCYRLAWQKLGMIYRYGAVNDDEHLVYQKLYVKLMKEYASSLPKKWQDQSKNYPWPVYKAERFFQPKDNYTNLFRELNNTSLTVEEKLQVVNAFQFVRENYVNEEVQRYYQIFTGQVLRNSCYHHAAGDGKDEKLKIYMSDRDPRGKYGQGLYSPSTYTTYSVRGRHVNDLVGDVLKVDSVRSTEFIAGGIDSSNTVHFNLWGIDNEFQNTVVIKVKEKSYLLFTKEDSELLHADSTFGGQYSYLRNLGKLRDVYIPHLENMIYGKEGFEWQIAMTLKTIENLEKDIKKTEIQLNNMRMESHKHWDEKKQEVSKKRYEKQEYLIFLQGQLSAMRAQLKKLREDYEKAQKKLAEWNKLLGQMQRTIGYEVVDFIQEGSIVKFEDGSFFDKETQVFTVAPYLYSQASSITMLPSSTDPFKSDYHEFRLFYGVVVRPAYKDFDFYSSVDNAFLGNQLKLSMSLDIERDSIFVEKMLRTDLSSIDFNLRGLGVSSSRDGDFRRDSLNQRLDIEELTSEEAPEAWASVGVEFANGQVVFSFKTGVPAVRFVLDESEVDMKKANKLLSEMTTNELLTALRVIRVVEEFVNTTYAFLLKYKGSDVADTWRANFKKALKKQVITTNKDYKWSVISKCLIATTI